MGPSQSNGAAVRAPIRLSGVKTLCSCSTTHELAHFHHQVYTQVVGFLVVFRCSIMYNRFWDGRTNLELMTSKWAIAAMQCTAFDNYGEDATVEDKFYMGGRYMTQKERSDFRQRILSLFSLLNATALSSLMHKKAGLIERECSESFFEVLPGINRSDVESQMDASLITNRVFLVLTWICFCGPRCNLFSI